MSRSKTGRSAVKPRVAVKAKRSTDIGAVLTAIESQKFDRVADRADAAVHAMCRANGKALLEHLIDKRPYRTHGRNFYNHSKRADALFAPFSRALLALIEKTPDEVLRERASSKRLWTCLWQLAGVDSLFFAEHHLPLAIALMSRLLERGMQLDVDATRQPLLCKLLRVLPHESKIFADTKQLFELLVRAGARLDDAVRPIDSPRRLIADTAWATEVLLKVAVAPESLQARGSSFAMLNYQPPEVARQLLAAGLVGDADYLVNLMLYPATLPLALESGAEIDMRNSQGMTALLISASNVASLAQLIPLLEHGANPALRGPVDGPDKPWLDALQCLESRSAIFTGIEAEIELMRRALHGEPLNPKNLRPPAREQPRLLSVFALFDDAAAADEVRRWLSSQFAEAKLEVEWLQLQLRARMTAAEVSLRKFGLALGARAALARTALCTEDARPLEDALFWVDGRAATAEAGEKAMLRRAPELALCYAATTKNDALVQELLDKGLGASTELFGRCLLAHAIDDGSLDIGRVLVAGGADLETRGKHGLTLLMRAVIEGAQVPVVKELLSAGANPNAVDDDGSTALAECVTSNYWRLAEPLLAAGADPNHGAVPAVLEALAVGGKDGSRWLKRLTKGRKELRLECDGGGNARWYAGKDKAMHAFLDALGLESSVKEPKPKPMDPEWQIKMKALEFALADLVRNPP
jgi:hypothetical protein